MIVCHYRLKYKIKKTYGGKNMPDGQVLEIKKPGGGIFKKDDIIQGGFGPISLKPKKMDQAIYDKWDQLGGKKSILGACIDTNCVTSAADDGIGRYNKFKNGYIYWTSKTGAFELHGIIYDKWVQEGAFRSSILGYPTSDVLPLPDGIGQYQWFQQGSIYWSPNNGCHVVYGQIREKWQNLGWEKGVLGYPIADRINNSQDFQFGTIYILPDNSIHEVHGDIYKKYSEWDKINGYLGYPTSDVLILPDRIGKYQWYQHGSIYWSPSTGANTVIDKIRDEWSRNGFETGYLGYPIADQKMTGDRNGLYQEFQHGTIFWSPTEGTKAVHGPEIYCTLTLENFRIYNTRAWDDDTDYVDIGIKIGNNNAITRFQSMGDVDNGVYPINLKVVVGIDPKITDTDNINFTFNILNKGGNQNLNEIKSSMDNVANSISSMLASTGNIWAEIGAGVIKVADIFVGLLFADCDGLVVSESLDYPFKQLKELLQYDGTCKIKNTVRYPGYDSNSGCGSNSDYEVTYSISRW